MPQRRKTLTELTLSGALKKNPKRYADRYHAPAVAGVGYAPRHLTANQKSIWREVVGLAPVGVLTAADEFAIELAVKLLERCRQQLPKPSEITVLLNLLGRLGMTPTDRAKLNSPPVPRTDPESPFAEFDRAFPVGTGGAQ